MIDLACLRLPVCMQLYMYALCFSVCVRVCVYVFVFGFIYGGVSIDLSLCVCVCVCVCACLRSGRQYIFPNSPYLAWGGQGWFLVAGQLHSSVVLSEGG